MAGDVGPPEGMAEVQYFRLDDGGAICRRTGGWDDEIWMAQHGEWRDATNINFATDAREIPEAEALAEVEGEQETFGEFASEPTDSPDAVRSELDRVDRGAA